MDYQKLAELLFPNVTETPMDVEAKFPPRNLPEGAKVTRFAPSPTGFVHFGGLFPSTIGERLARLALNQTYGNRHIALHGPTPVSAKVIDGKTIVEFTNAKELLTNDGEPLRELEIAGAIGDFSPIEKETAVKIDGNCIIIDKVVYCVRYAWKPYSTGNLVNEAALPASTFSIPVQQGTAAKH